MARGLANFAQGLQGFEEGRRWTEDRRPRALAREQRALELEEARRAQQVRDQAAQAAQAATQAPASRVELPAGLAAHERVRDRVHPERELDIPAYQRGLVDVFAQAGRPEAALEMEENRRQRAQRETLQAGMTQAAERHTRPPARATGVPAGLEGHTAARGQLTPSQLDVQGYAGELAPLMAAHDPQSALELAEIAQRAPIQDAERAQALAAAETGAMQAQWGQALQGVVSNDPTIVEQAIRRVHPEIDPGSLVIDPETREVSFTVDGEPGGLELTEIRAAAGLDPDPVELEFQREGGEIVALHPHDGRVISRTPIGATGAGALSEEDINRVQTQIRQILETTFFRGQDMMDPESSEADRERFSQTMAWATNLAIHTGRTASEAAHIAFHATKPELTEQQAREEANRIYDEREPGYLSMVFGASQAVEIGDMTREQFVDHVSQVIKAERDKARQIIRHETPGIYDQLTFQHEYNKDPTRFTPGSAKERVFLHVNEHALKALHEHYQAAETDEERERIVRQFQQAYADELEPTDWRAALELYEETEQAVEKKAEADQEDYDDREANPTGPDSPLSDYDRLVEQGLRSRSGQEQIQALVREILPDETPGPDTGPGLFSSMIETERPSRPNVQTTTAAAYVEDWEQQTANFTPNEKRALLRERILPQLRRAGDQLEPWRIRAEAILRELDLSGDVTIPTPDTGGGLRDAE